jgi:hypothetical protein
MADPFRAEARREKAIQVGGALLLICLLGALVWIFGVYMSAPMERSGGTVVRVGSFPSEFGDLPVLTVKMDDGAVRQIKTSRRSAVHCIVGSRVELVERGSSLSVGAKGCSSTRLQAEGAAAEATIIYIGPSPSKWRPGWVNVVARSSDGVTGTEGVSAERLNQSDCEIGNRVDARRRGAVLTLPRRSQFVWLEAAANVRFPPTTDICGLGPTRCGH